MESIDSNGTLDTQTILQIKARLLGEDQSEPYPQPKPSSEGHVDKGIGGHAMNPPPLDASNPKSQTTPTLSTNSPNSRDTNKSRRVTNQHAPPQLLHSKSSPVGAVSTAVHSKTAGAAAAGRMYHSFGGYMEDLGDTQPIDSQTFVQHSDLNTSRDAIHYTIEQETGEHTIGGKSYHEGDAGFIDLVGNIGANAAAIRETVDLSGEEEEEEVEAEHDDFSSLAGDKDDTDELSPESQFRLESNHDRTFILPKTPATRGKKRNRNGEVVSSQVRTSATKTPGSALAAIFGNNKGGFDMSMTQIFQTTQTASSPLPEGPRSDPVFERPSPNIHFHQRHSSPIAMSVSSPMKQFTSDAAGQARAPTDPLDSYLTMKESQERRRIREERERRQLDQEQEDDGFLGDITDSSRRRRFRLEQAKIRENAMTSCIDLKAPPRSSGRGPVKPSPQARRKSATDISSEIFQDTPLLLRTDSIVVGPILPSDVLTDEDSMDELSPHKDIQVPRTSSLPNGYSQPLKRARRASGENPRKDVDGNQSRRRRAHAADSPGATQKTVAVADSQGDGLAIHGSLQQSPQLLVHSSYVSNSQVGQTQYSALASQKRALLKQQSTGVIDTSSPPRPPQGSDLMAGDDKMPSSPPAMPTAMEADSSVDVIDLIDDVEQAADDEDLQDELSRSINAALDEQAANIGSLDHNELDANSASNGRSLIASSKERTETGTSNEVFETAPSQPSASLRHQNSGTPALLPSPHVRRIRKLTEIAADPTPENSFESVDLNINLITEDEQQEHAKLEKLFSGSSPVRPNKRRKVYTPAWKRALREPAQNANVQPEEPAIPESELDAAREQSPTPNAPASVKKRPTRTSKAASVPHQPAVPQPSSKPRPPPKRPTRKTSSLAPPRAPTASGRPKPRKLKVMEVAETPQVKPHQSNDPPSESPRSSTSRVPPNLVINTNTPSANRTVPQLEGEVITPPEGELEVQPNRVLARFRGTKMAYYPATCVGMTHTDGVRYKVRFDDGTIDSLESAHIRKLAFRHGDWVKVDLPDMRTKTYVVCGLKDKITPQADSGDELANPEQEAYPLTDVYCYRTVQLAVKGRDSLTAPTCTAPEIVDVPITSVYVTSTMWSRFSDRKFVKGRDDPVAFQNRISTPSIALSEPGTPTSRARRQAAINLSTSHVREPSTASFRREPGLFAHMAFAVTFTNSGAPEKSQSIKMIMEHGGILLDSGFDELFDVNMPEPHSPKKTSKKAVADDAEVPERLRLRPTAQKLGFTALIADRYCRRAKYMQALALDIPCLHFRWLTDSVAASVILPFQNYLLPAGESAFLSGAVRSRVLAPYDPLSDAGNLESVLSRRKLLLGSKSVLLVMGKGRAEERRKAYLFLTYALGAVNVGRVRDLGEARACLEGGEWDWVYVDGDVKEAEKALLLPSKATGMGGAGKKRKRGDGDGVKVVGDEFVIQSLILGALMGV